jgi:hypothetical protein
MISIILGAAFSLHHPKVVGDEMNNAVATWSEVDGTHYTVREASLTSGTTWSSPVTLSNPSEHSITPIAAINPSDNLLYLWVAQSGSVFEIFGASTLFGNAPSSLTQLSSTNSSFPRLAIDNNGNGVGVWQQMDASGYSVYGASYYNSIGWGSTVQIAASSPFLSAPVVAVQASTGAVVTLWQMEQDSVLAIQASTLSLGAGNWTTPQTLSSPTVSATNPQIVYNTLGEALGVWQVSVGSQIGLQTSSYNGSSWSDPITFPAAGNLTNPRVALNNIGEAVIVSEMVVDGNTSIVAIARSSMKTWGSVTTISGSDAQAAAPKVVLNDSHQAVVVWQNALSGANTVRSVRASNLSNWGSVTSLSNTTSLNTNPDVWVNGSGFAVAVWKKQDGTQISFQAATYTSGMWNAPQTISD